MPVCPSCSSPNLIKDDLQAFDGTTRYTCNGCDRRCQISLFDNKTDKTKSTAPPAQRIWLNGDAWHHAQK